MFQRNYFFADVTPMGKVEELSSSIVGQLAQPEGMNGLKKERMNEEGRKEGRN